MEIYNFGYSAKRSAVNFWSIISSLVEIEQGFQECLGNGAITLLRGSMSIQCHDFKCKSASLKRVTGTEPHFAALKCAQCDRWLKWMIKMATCKVLGRTLSREKHVVTEISSLLALPTWGEEA